MKNKFLILLLTSLLLTGCGADATTDNAAKNESQTQESVSTDVESTSVDETKASDSEAEEDANATGEEAKASEGSGNDAQDEEEAYALTFEATTVSGEKMTEACFADSKLTMLNVWATYCGPCLNEMPDLGEIAASYDKSEFQMIGIVSDVEEGADEELLTTAKDLIAETGADYEHLLLSESLYQNLVGGISSVPTTFFVNQEGELMGYVVGARDKAAWEEIINEVSKELE